MALKKGFGGIREVPRRSLRFRYQLSFLPFFPSFFIITHDDTRFLTSLTTITYYLFMNMIQRIITTLLLGNTWELLVLWLLMYPAYGCLFFAYGLLFTFYSFPPPVVSFNTLTRWTSKRDFTTTRYPV